ncbi:addiction module antidote protein, HigA family [Pseudoalteromonas ruthenica]|uniref:Addiction module antidote protein, HigA family n=2 Tax=Pseudoalteromonas ruthenica TaxID=151081 RepID=A0A5S3Z6R7_9GAMM|nr:addiction module antidote protein, HigA family [Pseudoalteromonas ruthenica]
MSTNDGVNVRMIKPPHPGETLKELYLDPLGLDIENTANKLGVSSTHLKEFLNGSRGITNSLAAKLADAFGGSAQSWLNQQKQYDDWQSNRIEYTASGLNALRYQYQYMLVIDVEHTCDANNVIPVDERELIELGAVILCCKTLKVEAAFSSLIKPVEHPILTDFCVSLTGIQQEKVQQADIFPVVFNRFLAWLRNYPRYLFCSWGAYDRVQLELDCKRHCIAELHCEQELNIKKAFAKIMKIKPRIGLKRAMEWLKLAYDGEHHRALSDAKNAAKILNLLLQPELSETMSKNMRLDIDALVEGEEHIKELSSAGFVNVSSEKKALHPANCFKQFYLPKLKAIGVSSEDIIARLGISKDQYCDFLTGKVVITNSFAKKLAALTGMRAEFWLRAQVKLNVVTEDKGAALNLKAESDELFKQFDNSELQEKLKISKIAGAAKGILSHIKANHSISDEESILQAIERAVEDKNSSKNDKS